MTFMGLPEHEIIISNKEKIKPSNKIAMKKWTWQNGWGDGFGTDTGYPFVQYLADVYYVLGNMAAIDGVQQLIHHYYLRSASRCDAEKCAERIKKLLDL